MTETDLTTPAVKHDIKGGGPVVAIIPQSIDEAFRVSRALAAAGQMVPQHFQGQPDAIMAAIMRGAEVGLGPMQSLANIAVINGRAVLWGDAIPAIMQRAGHRLDVVMEGEGDARKAVATLTRGDTGQEIIRTFSVADAKRAGLWDERETVRRKKRNSDQWYDAKNDSPWFRYPDRMLQMRARAFACRDGAADAMMGIQVREEMEDVERMRDITPHEPEPERQRTGFEQIADKAKERATEMERQREAAKEKPPADTGPDVIDGEAEEVDPEALVRVKQDGETAAAEGFERGHCPHSEGTALAAAWCEGWDIVSAATDEGDEDESQDET